MAIADTQEQANQMARAVKVEYKSLGKPILTIKDAIAAKSFFSIPTNSSLNKVGNAEGKHSNLVIIINHNYAIVLDAISKAEHKISGEISCGTQYHFHMETQVKVSL